MKIDSKSPVEEAVDELEADIQAGYHVLDMDQVPDYAGAIAVASGERAVRGLRAVLAALGDLEPGPALIVNDALRSGLGVTW